MAFIKMDLFCKVLICGLDTDSRLEHFKTFLKKTSFVVMVTMSSRFIVVYFKLIVGFMLCLIFYLATLFYSVLCCYRLW